MLLILQAWQLGTDSSASVEQMFVTPHLQCCWHECRQLSLLTHRQSNFTAAVRLLSIDAIWIHCSTLAFEEFVKIGIRSMFPTQPACPGGRGITRRKQRAPTSAVCCLLNEFVDHVLIHDEVRQVLQISSSTVRSSNRKTHCMLATDFSVTHLL